MSGLLYQLRDDFPNQLVLSRANAQNNSDTVRQYGVRGTPTLLIFHRGRQVKRWSGRIDVDEVYMVLENLLEPGKTAQQPQS